MILRHRIAGLIILTATLLSGFRAQGATNEKVTAGPLPDWFSPRAGLALAAESRRPARPDTASTGEEFILFDRQFDLASAAATSHIAYRITSQAGLSDGAQLSQGFDPSYESLTYHFIRLWRNGEMQDRLDLSEIKVLQQERDLDRQMYNGQLSTLLLLHDVRVGDIIEYACTCTGANPVFNGKFIESEYHGWLSPMRQQRLRVIVPEGRTVRFREQGARPLTHTEEHRPDGTTELWWEGFDLPPITADAGVPAWFVQFPYLELSEFKDWGEVTDWALPLYETTGPLAREVQEKLATLTRDAATTEDKVLAVLDFVQREVRYLGIELGPNTHRPHPPGTVFGQRFGDCKDKTLLLCAMLRELNIPAHPLLVSTYLRDKVARQSLPSPYAFNHVIARVMVDQRLYLLDATQSYQRGGLRARNPAEAWSGLALLPGTRALEQWNGEPQAQARTEISEVYDFPGYEQPAKVAISYRYRGERANQFRYYLANNSPEQVTRNFADAQKRAHPNLKLQGPLTWEDDESHNTILLKFAYTLSDLWKPQAKAGVFEAEFYPWALRDYINQPDNLTRTAPLNLNHPVNLVVRTTVNFPDDWTLADSKDHVETPWYDFSSYSRYRKRTLEMGYQWVSREDHVPAADLPTHVAKLEEIRKHVGYTLTRNTRLTRAMEQFSWNWLSLGLSAAIIAGWAWYGRWLLLRPPPTEPPLIVKPELQGLSGWLLLPALGLVIRPFTICYGISRSFDVYFDARTWIGYTAADSALYQPSLAGLILFELAGNLSLLMLAFIALCLFFKCKHRLPGTIILMLVFLPVFMLIDYCWGNTLHLTNTSGLQKSLQAFGQGVFAALIWVPYFLVSRRVKATFIR